MELLITSIFSDILFAISYEILRMKYPVLKLVLFYFSFGLPSKQ
jgi:hypothetical protein